MLSDDIRTSDILPPHTTTTANMGVTDVLSRKSGVIVGDDVLRLFEYAREKQFAIPAVVSGIPRARRCLPDAHIELRIGAN